MSSTPPKGPPPVDVRTPVARKVRCPNCHARFSTPQRFLIDCPGCGREWQEATVRTWREDLSLHLGDIADRAFKPVMLLLAFGLAIGLVGSMIFSLAYLGLQSEASTDEIIVFIAIVVAVPAVFGSAVAWRGVNVLGYWYQVARWRPGSRRDDRNR